MKFTREQLIKVMGLKEKDVVFCQGKKYIIRENKLICKDEQDGIGLDIILDIDYFLDKDFEIVKPKKKVGDTICREICCYNCPLKMLDCLDNNNRTLFEKLEIVHKEYNDKELYDILRARLDKEVEE